MDKSTDIIRAIARFAKVSSSLATRSSNGSLISIVPVLQARVVRSVHAMSRGNNMA